MRTLIVHESMFGNTEAVAAAIAEGLRATIGGQDPDTVQLVRVSEAPDTISDDITLLLVGGPTHVFSMTREGTRADAVKKGAAHPDSRGIRDWIKAVAPRADLSVVTFDTRFHVKMLPGSAAKTAAAALDKRGFEHAERGETFWVEGTEGPLPETELVRAREWGAELARRYVASA